MASAGTGGVKYCSLRLNVTEVNHFVEFNAPVDAFKTANQMTNLKSTVHQVNMILAMTEDPKRGYMYGISRLGR